jgi:SAM-dependent methyltransferase
LNTVVSDRGSHDVKFAKYGESGAYHWSEIGRNWRHHHAFTAERYRRVLAAISPCEGQRVLDYGCGDGALLGLISPAVGASGETHGFDPTPGALELASSMLRRLGVVFTLHRDPRAIPRGYFDKVVCSEVIEHVIDVTALLRNIATALKPTGIAVITSPVRLTETPEDPNHVREWFPEEFKGLFQHGPLELVHHQQCIPVAAAEVYYWRPRICFRIPLFRVLCNVMSIYGNVNALSWLGLRSRLFMVQMAVVKKRP